MARRLQDAVKWANGARRQHSRLVESYEAWRNHYDVVATDDGATWELVETREESGRLSDAYMVDGHLFLVAASQLVKTLTALDRSDLLRLLPSEHITHARNAMEHDDENGHYRNDYQGFGWIIGSDRGPGPGNIYGLEIAPVAEGIERIACALGPSTL